MSPKIYLPRIYVKRLKFLGEDIFRFVKNIIRAMINRLYHRSALSDEEMQFSQKPPTENY